MNEAMRDMTRGMTSILNEAIKAYHDGKPIMSDEQYDIRMKDLKEIEAETGCVLLNSPTHNADVRVDIVPDMLDIKEYYDIKKIADVFSGKKTIASVNPKGVNASLLYMDGILINIRLESECPEYKCDIKQFKNIPYKLKEKKTYLVCGKITSIEDKGLYFFTSELVDGERTSIYDSLIEANTLGFDIVPAWLGASLNPKKVYGFIDFAYEQAKDKDIPCDNIIFRFDDIKYNKPVEARGVVCKKNN